METFKFTKKTNKEICKAIWEKFYEEVEEVMAFATIKRHFFHGKNNVYVFKTYTKRLPKVYAYYEDTKTILIFNNENEAYSFILM